MSGCHCKTSRFLCQHSAAAAAAAVISGSETTKLAAEEEEESEIIASGHFFAAILLSRGRRTELETRELSMGKERPMLSIDDANV
jgi:hypothetical protein